MLGNNLIRDIILLMHLDIQPVVLHAESAFGYRLISGIVGIELFHMNSTSDTYKRTDERIHILQIEVLPVDGEVEGGFAIHVDVIRCFYMTFVSERCFRAVMPNGSRFIGDIGHSGVHRAFEVQFAAIDSGSIEFDI